MVGPKENCGWVSWNTHACELASKKCLFMHGKKVLSWEVQLSGRISPVCISTDFCMSQRLSHSLASSPSHVCDWVTFKVVPSLHAVIFFNKFYDYFLPKKLRTSWVCVFSLCYFFWKILTIF